MLVYVCEKQHRVVFKLVKDAVAVVRVNVDVRYLFDAVFAARRDTRAKASMPMDGLAASIRALLDEIQQALFDRAVKFRDDHTSRTDNYDEFKQIMEGRPGFVIAPWCEDAACEAEIKGETQATIRNIPADDDAAPGKPCVRCGKPAKVSAWFAKAY